ncbi:HesB/IscA family protein [Polycyclovorans algicola]|uniref:HesB/IscA family protein n=1 Tax=Polycyclovorans algicola TaxID=616992 RepID=UPI0004A75673|nr:iron-sulfur cluster assembly accessory protein [Polycyclovorans algicola]
MDDPQVFATEAVSLTAAAATRIHKQLAQRGSGVGLRVGVKRSGCSGWAYTLDYADTVGADDAVFESHDAKVVVARSHLEQLGGITVDFQRDGLNERFAFINPNVKGTCGCGESFAV